MVFLIVLGGLLFSSATSYAQYNQAAVALDQLRNGSATNPLPDPSWVNGNLGAQNSHYAEGMSVAYRAVMIKMPVGVDVQLTLEYDAKHSGKHALDYLTHFQRMEDHSMYGHDAEIVDPTKGTAFDGQLMSPTSTWAIPAPPGYNSEVAGMPASSHAALPGSEILMAMWGGTISGITYTDENGVAHAADLAVAQSAQKITVNFTAEAASVVLAWGGHIGSRLEWGYFPDGTPRSAGGISGSPYHMRIIDWNLNNLGNQDRSLSADAVAIPPTCDVVPVDQFCGGKVITFQATSDASSPTYVWTILNNTSGAAFVGPTNGAEVTVLSENPGGYTLHVEISDGLLSSECETDALVNDVPISFTLPADIHLCQDEVGASLSVTLENIDAIVDYLADLEISFSIDAVLQQDYIKLQNYLATNFPAFSWNDFVAITGDGDFPLIGDLIAMLGGSGSKTISVSLRLPTTGMTTDVCVFTEETQVTVNDNPLCSIAGDDSVCPDGEFTYTYDGTSVISTYAWSVSGDVAIIGGADGQSVTVKADAVCGTFTLSLVVTDENGCESSCEKIVAIQDEEIPVISTEAVDGYDWGCNPDEIPVPEFTATDNCGDFTPNVATDGPVQDAEGCGMSQTWTATVVDYCDNEAVPVSITYYWKVDLEAPVITAANEDSDLGCNPTAEEIEAALGGATAADNCDAEVTVEYTDGDVMGDDCLKSQTRTFTAVDECGNQAEAVTVTVSWKVDLEAPVITAANEDSDLGCNPTAEEIEAALGGATAADNCDAEVTVEYTDGDVMGDDCLKSQTRTFTAVDECGNQAEAVTVTVSWKVDLEAPVITAANEDSDLGCNPTAEEIEAALGGATAADNCDAEVTVEYTDGDVMGDDCLKSQTRTFTAVDECGNQAEAVTVTVSWKVDLEAPVITAANEDSDLGCNPTAEEIEAALGGATAADNCDAEVTVEYTDGDVMGDDCLKSQTRTFTAVDECGNQAEAVTVTVSWKVDLEAPVITAANEDSDLGCNPTAEEIEAALGGATAADNCDAEVTVEYTDGDVTGDDCLKSQTRTFTAVDECGNQAEAVTVTVSWKVDLEAPVITAANEDSDLGCNPTAEEIEAALGGATAADNCDAEVTVEYTDGDVTGDDCLKSQTRTFTAVDECGNQAEAVTVTVSWKVDLEAPVITAANEDSDLGCNPTAEEIEAALGGATAADNCDAEVTVEYTDGDVMGDDCLKSQTRTFTAVDECGNQAEAVTVTVSWKVDLEAPVITAANEDSDLGCNPTAEEIEAALGGATAADNCDAEVTVEYTDGDVMGDDCLKSQTRTFTAVDECGNQAEAVTVTVSWKVDLEAPVITAANEDSDLGCNPTAEEIEAALGGATAADNCDAEVTVEYTDGDVMGDDCLKSQTRTFTAVDECGNQAEAVTVTVSWKVDLEAPVITAANEDSDLGCNPTAEEIEAALGGATAADNCDAEVTVEYTDGDVMGDDCLKSQTRTFTAVDECGNQAEAVTVTVSWKVDLEAPVITAANEDSDLGCNPTAEEIEAALGGATAADNCDAEVTVEYTDGDVMGDDCLKSQTRTFTAVDECGNQAEAVTVTVSWKVDLEAPVITAANEDSDLGCNPTAEEIEAALGGATAADNCDAEVTVEYTDGDVMGDDCLKSQTRTFTAVDECGNQAEAVTVTVSWKVDLEAPVITAANEDSDLGCNPTAEEIEAALGGATAADNCDAEVTVEYTDGDVTGDDCLKSQTRTFTAVDECGNQAEAVTVTVSWKVDLEAPVITAANEDSDLGCNPTAEEIEAALGGATAADNCDAEVTVEYTDGDVMGDDCLKSQTRTFTAVDECGNQAEAVTVTVSWKVDLEGPVIECPDDIYVAGCELAPFIELPIATDNCDGAVEVTASRSDGLELNDPFAEGITTITFTAVDECGNNSTECVVNVTVDPCEPNCETAYGMLEGGSVCFLNDGFNRWGWTNSISEEGEYSMPLYAGAAQCNPDKGELVGRVEVTYSGSTLTVQYLTDPGYSMSEVHLYVGCDKYPLAKNGKETVAPGQYTHNAGSLNKVNNYTVEFTNVEGPVWVIAHAVTCDVNGAGMVSVTEMGVDCGGFASEAEQPVVEATEDLSGKDNKPVKIKAFPTPFDKSVRFEFVPNQDGEAQIGIYNLLGSKVGDALNEIVYKGRTYSVEFDGSGLPAGVYYYRFVLNNQTLTGKVIKNK
ncbi:T9SS type A sorting domain-containing protein [Gaoshiqia sp. Z1-71]|uniref:T9SS type A sorting domain-containing protein n=1 Tax=Gaoshiqia hydrogeniformans TaxID=3290090 RepID=UPI003BF836D2